MMQSKKSQIGVLAVLLGLAGTTGFMWMSLRPAAQAPPQLRYTSAYDLGERRVGDAIEVDVEFANDSDLPLRLFNFRSDYTCAALFRKEGGRFYPIEELVIAPKEQGRGVLRMVVRGTPSGVQRSYLAFASNDPSQAQNQIEFLVPRVKDNVLALPATVSFGMVDQGATAPTQRVELRDPDAKPRRVAAVTCDHPDVKVTWKPAASPAAEKNALGESLLGHIELELNTAQRLNLIAKIKVVVDDERLSSVEIPVSGRVVAAVEIVPAEIVLPRSSSQGKLYWVQCHARSMAGEPFELALGNVAAGYHVELLPRKANHQEQAIRIEVDPARVAAGERQVVEIKAQIKGRQILFPIVVMVHAPGGRPGSVAL